MTWFYPKMTLKWPSESSHVITMETLVHTWYSRLVGRWNRNYCKGINTIQLPRFHNLWQLWHGFTLKWPWSHQITTRLETLYHTRSLILINRCIQISFDWQIYKKSFSFICVPILMRFYPKMTLNAHIGHQRSITLYVDKCWLVVILLVEH